MGHRFTGIDVARALALLGIIANHTLLTQRWFSLAMRDVHAVVFALLIGVGAALELSRTREREGGFSPYELAAPAVRAVFIMVLGLTLGLGIKNVAVILVNLGLLMLAILPLRYLPTWVLIGVGGFLAAASPLLMRWAVTSADVYALYSPSWASFAYPRNTALALLFVEPYPLTAWLFYAIAGLVLARCTLLYRASAGISVALVGLVFVTVSVIAAGAAAMPLTDFIYWHPAPGAQTPLLVWLFSPVQYSASWVDLFFGLGGALVLTGFCVWFFGSRTAELPLGRFASMLTALGTMSLSAYVLHLVTTTRALPVFNAPQVAEYGGDFVLLGLQWALVCMLAYFWPHIHPVGPLEKVPRYLTRKFLK